MTAGTYSGYDKVMPNLRIVLALLPVLYSCTHVTDQDQPTDASEQHRYSANRTATVDGDALGGDTFMDGSLFVAGGVTASTGNVTASDYRYTGVLHYSVPGFLCRNETGGSYSNGVWTLGGSGNLIVPVVGIPSGTRLLSIKLAISGNGIADLGGSGTENYIREIDNDGVVTDIRIGGFVNMPPGFAGHLYDALLFAGGPINVTLKATSTYEFRFAPNAVGIQVAAFRIRTDRL